MNSGKNVDGEGEKDERGVRGEGIGVEERLLGG